MLSAQHRAIVSATVPILEQGGEVLTRHFYLGLFRDHPQVLAFFNQAHQHSGGQQRALANAVLMYAKNIERLENLGPMVATIVNKHVALQILPEHYPLVGASLLQAIREVLGADIATDAVIEAWGAAYSQLAQLLIGKEQAMYQQQAAAPGGWNGARAFIVAEKIVESDEITSFRLRPKDGGAVPYFAPGQFIGIAPEVGGVVLRRQYSLSEMANGRDFRISVKREPGGKVSNHLHDALGLGDSIDLFAPSGGFTLADRDKPLVLISGGVGITPTLAMLSAALRGQRQVHFIHAARHGGVHAFRGHVDRLASQHPQLKRYYCYAVQRVGDAAPDAVGLLDAGRLTAWLPAMRDVDVYLLGPASFMGAVRRHLRELGVPAGQTHHEFFGPASALD